MAGDRAWRGDPGWRRGRGEGGEVYVGGGFSWVYVGGEGGMRDACSLGKV